MAARRHHGVDRFRTDGRPPGTRRARRHAERGPATRPLAPEASLTGEAWWAGVGSGGDAGEAGAAMGAAGQRLGAAAGETGADVLGWYWRHQGRFPLLQPAEEMELGHRIARAKHVRAQLAPEQRVQDPVVRDTLEQGARAKEHLIVANLPLVLYLAQRFRARSTLEFGDLVQEGTIGLLRAVEQFDVTKGYRFATYAGWWIRHSLSRAVADHGTPLRLPAAITAEVRHFKRAVRLRARTAADHAPTIDELAATLGWEPDKTRRIAELAQATVLSLDTVVGADQRRGRGRSGATEAPGPEAVYLHAETTVLVAQVLHSLPAKHQAIVRGRYGFDTEEAVTLAQLGEQFGVSLERIRQLQAQALATLRQHPLLQRLDGRDESAPVTGQSRRARPAKRRQPTGSPAQDTPQGKRQTHGEKRGGRSTPTGAMAETPDTWGEKGEGEVVPGNGRRARRR